MAQISFQHPLVLPGLPQNQRSFDDGDAMLGETLGVEGDP